MTQEKRDSMSPVGLSSVGVEGERVGGCAGGGQGGCVLGYFLPLSVECGLQDVPCSDSSDSHFRFAVGDEVWLRGWVVLGASSQGVAGAGLSRAQLALVPISLLPPKRLILGVPALKVGGGVVGQGVGGRLVGAGLLSVLLGGAMLRTEGPRLILHSYGMQRQVPLGGQLGQVPSLGVEVIIYLVGCTMGQVGGRRGEERAERGRERRERKTVRD